MKKWSNFWKKSKRPSKQRLYARRAPLHLKSKMICSHLSKELKAKHGTRSLRVKKGDRIKVLRGQYKGKSGIVEKVSIKLQKVFVNGIETVKKEGAKSLYPLHHSNILIIELNNSDKFRLGEKK